MIELSLHSTVWVFILALLIGWLADLILGDPSWLPHPIVFFGKTIAWGEQKLNRGKQRASKGACFATMAILGTFAIAFSVFHLTATVPPLYLALSSLTIFFCLAGTTLIREVREVFCAVGRSPEDGRRQVGRIVGRDTQNLSEQEIKTAALETLAENLSDGVIAPLFWLVLLGPAGMITYKMVNTLDSMIGYKTERYREFGRMAAHIDDVANFIPARLTAMLMILVSGEWGLFKFVAKHGRRHASPNSGYPEAALAGILKCRFGGPHHYFGEMVEKPYIGDIDKQLTHTDLEQSIRINRRVERLAVLLSVLVLMMIYQT